jgi:hypothetical protein
MTLNNLLKFICKEKYQSYHLNTGDIVNTHFTELLCKLNKVTLFTSVYSMYRMHHTIAVLQKGGKRWA